MNSKLKREKRFRRKARVRAKISGTNERPRLCVFKSNKYIYVQLIDDEKGQTLAGASDIELTRRSPKKRKTKISRETDAKQKREGEKDKSSSSPFAAARVTDAKVLTGKVAIAFEVGKLIAEKAIKNKFEKVVFDKASYRYQGRVKALAEGAREGGLIF